MATMFAASSGNGPSSILALRGGAGNARANVARYDRLLKKLALTAIAVIAVMPMFSDTRDCRSLAVAGSMRNSHSRNAMPNPKVRHHAPQRRQISLRAYVPATESVAVIVTRSR
jgi:hypothetical protein